MSELFTYVNSKAVTYFLNCKEQKGKSGKVSRLYYFSKESGERTITSDKFPEGRAIKESKNGFPIVYKPEAADAAS